MVSDTGMDWAKANGVSDGINPTVNITHEQLVTMLYRYAGFLNHGRPSCFYLV